MDLCTVVSPFLDMGQQIMNFAFGFLSFFGITAPDLGDIFGPILGCTFGSETSST